MKIDPTQTALDKDRAIKAHQEAQRNHSRTIAGLQPGDTVTCTNGAGHVIRIEDTRDFGRVVAIQLATGRTVRRSIQAVKRCGGVQGLSVGCSDAGDGFRGSGGGRGGAPDRDRDGRQRQAPRG